MSGPEESSSRRVADATPIHERAGRHFVDNLELWLSSVGLGVIFAAPVLFIGRQSADASYWKVAGMTAIAVGVIHGVIFWIVRRRQRNIREQTLSDVRRMLADVVNSDLQVILFGLETHPELLNERNALRKVEKSIRRITASVDALSLESLREWREKYPDH